MMRADGRGAMTIGNINNNNNNNNNAYKCTTYNFIYNNI